MKLLRCPLNGWRNIAEFTYGGECRQMPDPERSSARDWAEYVFFDDNEAGIVTEWWCHRPSSYWFLAERDTVTDEIIRTYPASEKYSQRPDSELDNRKSPGS